MTITGVRWAESVNRRNNQGHITVMKGGKQDLDALVESGNFSTTRRGGVVLNNDNEESRKMVEQCYKLSKTVVNPIIDWDDGDVWEFIHEYNIPYCKLYDEGWKRLGCIGCPMATKQHREQEFERWSKFKDMYIKAFDKCVEKMHERGRETEWKSGRDMFNWWMGR